MKRLLVLSSLVLFAVFSSQCLAHDGTIDPFEVTSWSQVERQHNEPAEGPFKGYAWVTVTNMMDVSWTDFHFVINPSDVIFRDPTAQEGTYPVAMLSGFPGGSEYVGASYEYENGGTLLSFEFEENPVEIGEMVTFQIYTDNTGSNPWFTLCMYPTPEPATLALLGLGALVLLRKRK